MNIRIELPEILVICATFLCVYNSPVTAYSLFTLGLLVAACRTGLNYQHLQDEKKRKEKYENDLKMLLIQNSVPKVQSDPDSGSGGYQH